jgi:3',5'-cyclic AMP phosphodiesterase CpdA
MPVMAAFTLAHLSDPHLPPLPRPRLTELAGKRALGYLNWTRNRHRYQRRDVLDVLISDLQAQVPGHIAITGDLVNLSLEAEFAPARAWLESVGPSERVTVVPGNHDAYVRATRHCFTEAWGSYLAGDDTNDHGTIFPALRRRGPIALVSVSSAVPTAPLMATGRLGQSQMDALERMLAALASEQTFRILLIHHPLRSSARAKRLTDSSDLLALLKQYGVELVLHGHDHVHSTIWIEGPNGQIPAIGVPSASAQAHGRYPDAAYNLFSIARDGAAWRCQQMVRGINEAFQVREIRRVRLI